MLTSVLNTNIDTLNYFQRKYNPIGDKKCAKFDDQYFIAVAKKKDGSYPGFYAQTNNSKKSRWMAKVGFPDHCIQPLIAASRSFSTMSRRARMGAYIEYTAATLYRLWSTNCIVPNTKLAELTWLNEYTKDHLLLQLFMANINLNRPEKEKLTKGLHILSKIVENYHDIKEAKVIHNGKEEWFMDYLKTYGMLPEKIKVGNEVLRYEGTPEVLAIGKLILDIDIMGAGNNLGFVIEESKEGKIARAVKVDPGFAFCINIEQNLYLKYQDVTENNVWLNSDLNLTDSKDIQIDTHGKFLKWSCLSRKQQKEFLFAIYDAADELANREFIKQLLWQNGILERELGCAPLEREVDNLLDILTTNKHRVLETYTTEFENHNLRERVDHNGKYFGEFERGLMHGYGIFKYKNGSKYVGQWANNLKSGEGIYIDANGQRYKGEFVDNNAHGFGVCYFTDGTKYSGSWNRNILSGHGVFTWPDGRKYVGEFKDGLKHGYGKLYYNDGRIYEGPWVNNFPHGHGVFTWPDKGKYEGQFINGVKHGYGKLYYSDGRIYAGQWESDLENGKGRAILPNGDILEGDFFNGYFPICFISNFIDSKTIKNVSIKDILEGKEITPDLSSFFFNKYTRMLRARLEWGYTSSREFLKFNN